MNGINAPRLKALARIVSRVGRLAGTAADARVRAATSGIVRASTATNSYRDG